MTIDSSEVVVLHIASFIKPAEALVEKLDGSPTVAGLVPSGFTRYLRVFIPASVSSSSEPGSLELHLPWSLICEQLGIELRPNTMWQRDIVSVDARIADFHEPGVGTFGSSKDIFQRLGTILQKHETEDRSWYFATWVGYGVLEGNESVWFPTHAHGSLEMSVFERWNEETAPFDMPLVPSSGEGMTVLSAFGHGVPTDFIPPGQIPMYWWPEGSEWVVGQALYGRSIYLACDDAIAEEVLAMPGLDAIEVSLSDEGEREE